MSSSHFYFFYHFFFIVSFLFWIFLFCVLFYLYFYRWFYHLPQAIRVPSTLPTYSNPNTCPFIFCDIYQMYQRKNLIECMSLSNLHLPLITMPTQILIQDMGFLDSGEFFKGLVLGYRLWKNLQIKAEEYSIYCYSLNLLILLPTSVFTILCVYALFHNLKKNKNNATNRKMWYLKRPDLTLIQVSNSELSF